MSALILLTVSMLTVVAVDAGSLDASFAGFALSLALGIVGMLSFMVRVWAELENAMNASERITYDDACLPPHLLPACGCLTPLFRRHYADNTPSEAADVIKDTSSGGVIAPAEWPQRGSITFENVKMRYRPTTPLVLKGISLTISPMEKVGIAGRSGCGKSTLLKCLFRYVACVCGPSECPWAHVVVQARRSGGEDHH